MKKYIKHEIARIIAILLELVAINLLISLWDWKLSIMSIETMRKVFIASYIVSISYDWIVKIIDNKKFIKVGKGK